MMPCGHKGCTEAEDRIAGYCSIYCRDVAELEKALGEQCAHAEALAGAALALKEALQATLIQLMQDPGDLRVSRACARMDAALARLPADALAERRRLEDALQEAQKIADFLRESVGECHLMLSRNTPEYQVRKEWERTSLPARLSALLAERRALEACAEVLMDFPPRATRGEWKLWDQRRIDALAALAAVRRAP